MTTRTEKTKVCSNCTTEQPVEEFTPDRNEPDGRHSWCHKCRIDLGRALSEFRRQQVVHQVAQKTSIGEDLLAVIESPIGSTVERLLDSLATLAEATSAARGKTLEATRGKPQHAPLPRFDPAWAEQIQSQTDDRLWELTEELTSFLNRPTDPKTWAACDTCGNKRLGDSSYCRTCGSRILEGARRCRTDGCPNRGNRRSECPRNVIH